MTVGSCLRALIVSVTPLEPAQGCVVIADPPVRADGRCLTCNGPRTAHRKSKPLYRAAAERDPFCSTKCAREWHGCALPAVRTTPAQQAAAEQAGDRFRDLYPYRETAPTLDVSRGST